MVTDYIEHRIQESITLHELAAIAGLSIRQFARSFQASKGKTPARYIHDRRLGRAREMLAMPGFSMTDVAYACGFSHAQHFSNSFQRSTGMTPTEFRQANGGDATRSDRLPIATGARLPQEFLGVDPYHVMGCSAQRAMRKHGRGWNMLRHDRIEDWLGLQKAPFPKALHSMS
jgi:AraC-like DNA-binding protein